MKMEDLERALQDAKYHHVQDDVLVSYRDQQLDAISRTQIEAHLNLCLICERRLLRLREEREAVNHYEPRPEDRTLVRQAIQRVQRERALNTEPDAPNVRASAWERFAEQVRQAGASWRIFAMQLTPVRGAARSKEIWQWQSEDGRVVVYAKLEPNADLTFHFSSSDPESEGARFKIKVGSLSREVTLERLSESESRAEVTIKRRQRPKHLRDISIENA